MPSQPRRAGECPWVLPLIAGDTTPLALPPVLILTSLLCVPTTSFPLPPPPSATHTHAHTRTHPRYHMRLAFVTPEQAARGFSSSTFSFNLPTPAGATPADAEALAQRFVDLLCVHDKQFKPCVSFGQDNGLVYATVPATSTQVCVCV
jgi:hypothetical protein